jgi:hypothetical protein
VRYRRRGENELRGCFVKEGIIVKGKGKENAGTVES